MALPSEEIKERLDIVQFLKDYLELRPAGRNFKALCPFHQEKTPSFIVSPERQIWHCFGCGKGGDIFKFLMEYENLEFYEALKILAEKAGVELQKLSPVDQKQFGILYDINSIASRFFSDNLEASPRVREYLRERGLFKETIYEFELGFAPNSFDALTVNLINEGFNVEDIVRAGLAFKTERGKYIDRFRGRIMFPIHNHFGKVVGFSGRILPELEKEDVGKYINSPETPIFNKSRLLYGFWKSKNSIRAAKTLLLVEGQMDFLMLWQAGIKNVVATSGTSLSGDHLKTSRKIADNIIIAFDKDEAGIAAAERAIDLAGAADFNAYVLDFGEFKDPAEATQANPELMIKAVGKPIPAIEYYFIKFIPGSEKATKEDVRNVLTKIKNLWSRIERANWIRELSHKTGIPTKELSEELERIELREITREEQAFPAAIQIKKNNLSRLENIAVKILSLVSIKEEFNKLVNEKLKYMPKMYAMAYEAMQKGIKGDASISGLVDEIILKSSLDDELEEEKLQEEINKLLKELEFEYIREERKEIGHEILLAEEKGAGEEELILKLKEFDELTRRMQDIENTKKEVNR